jgi:methionyl-tRNA formyltransferase
MVEPLALRVALFGTPEFAVPTLAALLASRHAVVGVVTQPDRPQGRGQRLVEGPVKRLAISRGVPVLQPDRLKAPEFVEALRAWQLDLGVVAAYGKILPEAVLALPRLGLVNVHASLLPRYRGAAPVHRAVVAGERETGVSIMQVVQALDAGPVYDLASTPIGPDDTSAELEDRLARLGADALLPILDALAKGTATATAQDDQAATYAHRLRKEEGVIDWRAGADAIHNQVRGLQPWPLAWSMLAGHRLIVLRTRVSSVPSGPARRPGEVAAASAHAVTVQTGHGTLDLLMVQPEGRRAMSIREFAAGHRIGVGERFDAPGIPSTEP